MTDQIKSLTVISLVDRIYEDNSIHFDFDEDMNNSSCDCYLHLTMETIAKYWY